MIPSSSLHGQGSIREQEYLSGWQRSRAELVNARQRHAQARVHDQVRWQATALEPLLTIADHFRTLVAHLPPELEANSWAQGVRHIAREFERILVDQGIELIDPQHETFDPVLHEAVGHEVGERTNEVLQVVQVGYKLGDRVLRPAKVKVIK